MRHLIPFLAGLALMVIFMGPAPAAAGTAAADNARRIVALGDSLTAGYGLESGQSFTTILEKALNDADENVRIDNAGVSGDTAAGGRARLDWAIGGDPKPDLVIVALGANDMLRGLDPALTRDNLKAILQTLKDRDIPALLVGMRSPANMGAAYQKKFDGLYADLSQEFGVPLYPFFLDGVALDPKLNQGDGVHPTLAGVEVMVERILPTVRKALKP